MIKKANFVLKHIVTPAAILLAGVSFAKPTIKSLTSSDTAKKVENEVEDVKSNPNRTIPGALKVHSVGIGLGQTFLTGDFEDNGDDKITWDLFYSYSASYSFDFIANAHYSKHKYKGRSVTLSSANFGIKGKVYQMDSFSPFVQAGLGFYQPKMRRIQADVLTDSESKVVFGYHIGAGIDLDLNSRFKVGVLATLHNPFDVDQENQEKVEGAYHKLMMTCFYKF